MKFFRVCIVLLSLGGCAAFLNWPPIDIPNPRGVAGMKVFAASGIAWIVVELLALGWRCFRPGGRS